MKEQLKEGIFAEETNPDGDRRLRLCRLTEGEYVESSSHVREFSIGVDKLHRAVRTLIGHSVSADTPQNDVNARISFINNKFDIKCRNQIY
jgi:hypothetical protein